MNRIKLMIGGILMRILLKALVVTMLLTGCANQTGGDMGHPNGSGSSSTSTSSSSSSSYQDDMSDIGGMMESLKMKGLQYENEMEIVELEDGFEEGRRFTSNGVTYGLFRYDENNETFRSTLEEAKSTGYMYMNVNGQKEQVPVHVYKNYILAYPKDADVTDMMNYFR